MAIVVGDIHGNVEKVQAFLDYRPDQLHIALGDYLDSYHESVDRQYESLLYLLVSDAVLLWGNHELHYLKKPPFICSGYNEGAALLFRNLLEEHKHRFTAARVADGWLCTHGGVAQWLAGEESDPRRLADRLNQEMDDYLRKPGIRRTGIFAIGHGRGGSYGKGGGIFWFDTLREYGIATQVRQVTGHTEQQPFCSQSLVALDTTNNRQNVWLFDTELNELVKLGL